MLTNLYQEIYSFLIPLQSIWQTEPLNQYPISNDSILYRWTMAIMNLSDDELVELESNMQLPQSTNCEDLHQMLEASRSLVRKTTKSALYTLKLHPHQSLKMTLKKTHEIEQIISLLKNEALKFESVIDFGSGVGHLGQVLSEQFATVSYCLDSNQEFLNLGQERINRWFPKLKEKVIFKKVQINDQIDFKNSKNDLCLGLHACGSLSNHLIKYFLSTPTQYFLNLGCCYHKQTKAEHFNISQYAKQYPLLITSHARHLAANCYSAINIEKINERRKIKMYRYALHFYLLAKFGLTAEKLGSPNRKIYDQSFADYAAYNLEKLNLEINKKELSEFYNDPKLYQEIEFLIRAGVIRSLIGRCVELAIVLDRAIYLAENNYDVKIIELFDRKLSPRNLAILAKKKGPLKSGPSNHI